MGIIFKAVPSSYVALLAPRTWYVVPRYSQNASATGFTHAVRTSIPEVPSRDVCTDGFDESPKTCERAE